MKVEKIIINVIFDAGKGKVSLASREATCGEPIGSLPRPARAGYRFAGWYLNGSLVDEQTVLQSEEDVRLEAAWEKERQKKKSSMLKRQKIAVAALSAVCVLLIAVLLVVNEIVTISVLEDTYFVEGVEQTARYYIKKKDGAYALYHKNGDPVEQNDDGIYIVTGGNQYKIDSETGEWELYAVVDTEGSEVVGFNNRVLIFPQIKQSNVYSIEVHSNQYEPYRFYRNADGDVVIEGQEESPVAYNKELYASLCVSCGYTIASHKLDLVSKDSVVPRLEDGSVDYAAFGLADLYDAEGNLTYTPTTYTITQATYAENGEWLPDANATYTVKIGDQTLPGGGYYAQLEGRDAIYILGYTLEDTILQPIEALVTPQVLFPLSLSTYMSVNNFLLGTVDMKGYTDTDNLKIEPIVSFSYLDLAARLNTMNQQKPYLVESDLMDGMGGYDINDQNASDVLSLLSEMEYIACRKLGLDAESLKDYQLDGEVFCLSFDSPVTNENGFVTGYIENFLLVSPKTANGTYYVASYYYDMIVEVDQYYFSYLEQEISDWYLPNFFTSVISHVSEMKINVLGKDYTIRLDDSQSYMFYEAADGTMEQIDTTVGYVTYDANGTPTYVDQNGKRHAVKCFDLSTGSYYFRIIDMSDGSVTYEKFNNYRFTVDRNGCQTLQVMSNNKKETDYVLTYMEGSTQKRARSYSLVYRDSYGEEFAVLGSYVKDSEGGTVQDYFQLPYWKEVATTDAAGNTTYKWERITFSNQSFALILRDADNRVYSIEDDTANMRVYCDAYTAGKTEANLLDYTVVNKYITDTGLEKTETISALDNFRQFFTNLAVYTIEGDVDEEVFVQNKGMTMQEYIKNNECDASIFFQSEDFATVMNMYTVVTSEDEKASETRYWTENNEKDVMIRFYKYSDRKALITVEVIEDYDENGNPVTNPENIVTQFYVLADLLDWIQADLTALITGNKVTVRN